MIFKFSEKEHTVNKKGRKYVSVRTGTAVFPPSVQHSGKGLLRLGREG
jgi:hypothetical protein